MKRMRSVAMLVAVLALGALLRADDTVVLTDGSVLQGQVMQETSNQVVLMDHGTQRTLQRSLVAKVEFNTSPSSSDAGAASGGDTVPSAQQAPGEDNGAGGGDAGSLSGGNSVPSDQGGEDATQGGGNTMPAAPTQEEQDYAGGVSDYYQVPSDQVWGFEEQGIPYEELPVVFYVARHAMVAPGLVVGLRLRGMSWADICMHFGLEPGIFYWGSLFSADLGGPYGGIYRSFHHYPYRHWRWGLIDLSDADIINCVNLRFDTAYWHLRPYDVVRWRGLGHPFFWGGYGYGHGYGHGTWHGYGHGAVRGRVGWGAQGRAGFGGRARGGWQGQGRVHQGQGRVHQSQGRVHQGHAQGHGAGEQGGHEGHHGQDGQDNGHHN